MKKRSIDFKNRTINGITYEGRSSPTMSLKDCLSRIEELYETYKFSTPTEGDDPNAYFYAMRSSEMTDAELVLGADRFESKVALELFVLDAIVSHTLYWDKSIMGGNWYWKSKKDPDLVILREWIE